MTTATAIHTDLHRLWLNDSVSERIELFKGLPLADAQEFFRELSTRNQFEVIENLSEREQTVWLRLLDPDDAADLLQEADPADLDHYLHLLDSNTRDDVQALLKYREDVAGGLMSPRFVRVRPEMTVAEALTYVRKQARDATETIYTIYVLDAQQVLLGVTSLRTLITADALCKIKDVMRSNVISASDQADQEQLSRLFAEHDLMAIPIVDEDNKMKGIVTVDDIVDVVEEEATEDIQKIGGSEVLGAPYLDISLGEMIRKRAGWLVVLFLSEMLTANAMGHFQDEISKAVILAVFIPLVISSGGNSGSQASTIIIRAMALGEVTLRDWFKVMKKELVTGIALGALLGLIGFARVIVWQQFFPIYGAHYVLLAATIGLSLLGIVLWGTLSGSLLPLILRKVGFDPATASTPFVATLVDVTGLVIYFTVATAVLHGTLL